MFKLSATKRLTALAVVLASGSAIVGMQAFAQTAAPADKPGEKTVVTPEDGRPLHIPRGTGAPMNYPTELNTVILNAEQTAGNFTFTDQRWLPGDWTNTHYHKSAAEAFYVISGEFNAVAGGKDITVKAGDMLYLPPHTLHKFTASREGQGAHVILVVAPGEAGFPWPLELQADGSPLDTH